MKIKVAVAVIAVLVLIRAFAFRPRPIQHPMQTLTAEEMSILGEWINAKKVEGGSVYRQLMFHREGNRFTTTCHSKFDKAVANGHGVGTWTVVDGTIKVNWIETQTVGQHSQEEELEFILRIESTSAETCLIVTENGDVYKRKRK